MTDTAEHHEAEVVVSVKIMTDEDTSVVVKPSEESFDFPSPTVSSQRATVLRRGPDHGYATTSYRSQGRTVDAVFALASSAEARRGLYVDVTRA